MMLVAGVAGEELGIVVGHGVGAEAEGEGEDSDCVTGRLQLPILCFNPYILVHYLSIFNQNGQHNCCRVSSTGLTTVNCYHSSLRWNAS